jgi:hypothetical protein
MLQLILEMIHKKHMSWNSTQLSKASMGLVFNDWAKKGCFEEGGAICTTLDKRRSQVKHQCC